MRERITKFILIAAAVILIGTGITLFNWKGWGAGSSSGGAGVSMAADRGENVAVCGREETSQEKKRETAAQAVAEDMAQEHAEETEREKDGVASLRYNMENGGEEQKTDGFKTEKEMEEAVWETENSSEQKLSESRSEEAGIVIEEERSESFGESIVILEIYANREEARDAYYGRLGEMDKKLTAKAEESYKKPIADQKTIADEIWKFWDDELNAIYQELRGSLTEEEFDALREEERAWLKNRDELAARAAASENSSNSAQNLAYTRSLAESTKLRVYELAEMFYSYCREEEK